MNTLNNSLINTDHAADHSEPSAKSSSALLTAALAGLMGMTACGKKHEDNKAQVTPGPELSAITSTTVDKTMTLAKFSADCQTRGGLVQTHAACSGNNSCKGVSFHSGSGKLTEHSCKASNICSGMSCVDLPKDGGLTGAEILLGEKGAEVKCNFCHGESQDSFTVPVAPGTDIAQAPANFLKKSAAAQVGIVAFGLHGINADGTAYANMPGFYQLYSRAEIERLIDHIRTLTIVAEEWKSPK